MSVTFPFVPRTVSRAKQKPASGPSVASSSNAQTVQMARSQPVASDATDSKLKRSNQDYALLLSLALSNYALWTDPDLRRTVDWSGDEGSDEHTEGGFFPLSYVLKQSQLLAPLELESLQTPIAKALRAPDAVDLFEVRLLVSDPSPSTWFGTGSRISTQDVGAYEIRRKHESSAGPSRDYSKVEWDKRTVYVENIPAHLKTASSISKFILTLLADCSSSKTSSPRRVQGVIFPPHHQDKPGDQPSCKGFALIVLEDEEDVKLFLDRWRWERQAGSGPAGEHALEGVQDAMKFGFRTLSKHRWDQLKEEYLSYREKLVAEINAHQDAEASIHVPLTQNVAHKPTSEPAQSEAIPVEPSLPATAAFDYSSPYPLNTLVFVRNIHPETNKTTLRKLFATALGPALASGELSGDGLDYVDFNKGMDSCHLRLATPKHARILVNYLLHHPTSQVHGLDEVGTPAQEKSPSISVELVTGKREELYWEKVPQKVRQQAVQKALASRQESLPNTHDSTGANGDARKRKRRKH